jgi:putative hydrolases of HD superfamily
MKKNRDVELLYELGTLRFLQRTWEQFLTPEFANIVEHMYRMTWIAMIIARHEVQVDEARVIKMCLVHDITESRGVDRNYLKKHYSTSDEILAAEHTLEDTVFADEFLELRKEFEEAKTIEAKIANDADKLDCSLELKEQESRGNTFYALKKEFRQQIVYPKLFTKKAKKLWHEIENSNPHDWHIIAKRRF